MWIIAKRYTHIPGDTDWFALDNKFYDTEAAARAALREEERTFQHLGILQVMETISDRFSVKENFAYLPGY